MLETLDKNQRGAYYRICGSAEAALKKLNMDFNPQHCEFICESLIAGRPITPRMLKALCKTEEPPQRPQPDLFS